MLWIALTLTASVAQTARNALQRELTSRHGALGAAHARFLYGLPFAVLFLLLVGWWDKTAPPLPAGVTVLWAALGGMTQIAGTALLLKAMQSSAFVVAVAYSKTEPLLVLLVAWLVLGGVPTAVQTVAIVLATAGVVLMSWPGVAAERGWFSALLLGVASGAGFAVSALCYRQGIMALDPALGFVMRATLTLVTALTIQTLSLSAWLMWRRPGVMRGLLRDPLAALPAGLAGAVASQFWFLAFAVQTAALVRTLALVEVPISQMVTRRFFAQTVSPRQKSGLVALCVGLAGLILGG